MPKVVDAAARRAEIVRAAAKLISEGGFPRMTLANLARELGGSMRLVTHYFKDRQQLITALLEDGLRETDEILERLRGIESDRERLREALAWFLPDDPESLRLERVRLALIAQRDEEPVIAEFFDRVDRAMRSLLDCALPEGLSPEERERSVDVLRVWTSGMSLVSVEHPELWSPAYQRETLGRVLEHLSAAASREP